MKDRPTPITDAHYNGIRHHRPPPETIELLRTLERQRAELRLEVLKLRTEVSCRTGHGAESNGHLEYVLTELDTILANSIHETL